MLINPKTITTSSNDRYILRRALEQYIKAQNKRAAKCLTIDVVEQAQDDAARAADLFRAFS